MLTHKTLSPSLPHAGSHVRVLGPTSLTDNTHGFHPSVKMCALVLSLDVRIGCIAALTRAVSYPRPIQRGCGMSWQIGTVVFGFGLALFSIGSTDDGG